MAIYRSQKPAWEDALLKHSTPSLVTTTTPALQSLDLSNVNVTGVGKKKLQSLGLAATLRHVRAERLIESGGVGGLGGSDDDEVDEEENEEKTEKVESEKRKKRRVEEGDDLVLGFDFAPRPVKVVEAVTAVPAVNGDSKKKKAKGKPAQKGKGKGMAAAGAVDGSKRPAAKEGWWEDD